jgi:hypothetical protein
MSDSHRRCVREFAERGTVEKEREHVYQDLKRAGYFIDEERGESMF